MIFFNVPQAKRHLLEEGLVYTLRSKTRATGKTMAVTGSYQKNLHLCSVYVERVLDIRGAFDLIPYVKWSGFRTSEEWIKAASNYARTLYMVVKI